MNKGIIKKQSEKRSLLTVEKTVVHELVRYRSEINDAFEVKSLDDYKKLVLEILDKVPHTQTQQEIVANFTNMTSKLNICSYIYSLILAGDNNKVIH